MIKAGENDLKIENLNVMYIGFLQFYPKPVLLSNKTEIFRRHFLFSAGISKKKGEKE